MTFLGESEPRSKLPREIWRWLLGFSLKGKIKNVRRDFSNGYVIAEVCIGSYWLKIKIDPSYGAYTDNSILKLLFVGSPALLSERCRTTRVP